MRDWRYSSILTSAQEGGDVTFMPLFPYLQLKSILYIYMRQEGTRADLDAVVVGGDFALARKRTKAVQTLTYVNRWDHTPKNTSIFSSSRQTGFCVYTHTASV
jgi:hypothetical protein